MSKALDRERRIDDARRTTAESKRRPKADPFKGDAANVPQPTQDAPARPLPRVAAVPARPWWGVALLSVPVALMIIGAFAWRARSSPSEPAVGPPSAETSREPELVAAAHTDAQPPSAPDAVATGETRMTDAMDAALDNATRVLRLMDAAMRDAARLGASVQASARQDVGESGREDAAL